ncbi:hypothetical protein NFI96_023531, partial [Prochilodus magdalenae]
MAQLQKMVQDIKKNDDSLFNRLKRFQTEQTANILKTGRNTLDRMVGFECKGPIVNASILLFCGGAKHNSDSDNQDTEWSGSEFDSDVYEDPQGEHDDNYEPPPCERHFIPAPSNSFPVGEYLDKCPGRPTQSKPNKPLLPIKPVIPEKPNRAAKDDEDYIDPEEGTDDNYIDPSQKDPHANKGKPGIPRRSHSP